MCPVRKDITSVQNYYNINYYYYYNTDQLMNKLIYIIMIYNTVLLFML